MLWFPIFSGPWKNWPEIAWKMVRRFCPTVQDPVDILGMTECSFKHSKSIFWGGGSSGAAVRTLRSQPDPSCIAPRDQIRRKEPSPIWDLMLHACYAVQWFSMFLPCFSMLLQCFYTGFQCFYHIFYAFRMVSNAFAMLLQLFLMILQCLQRFYNGFTMVLQWFSINRISSRCQTNLFVDWLCPVFRVPKSVCMNIRVCWSFPCFLVKVSRTS